MKEQSSQLLRISFAFGRRVGRPNKSPPKVPLRHRFSGRLGGEISPGICKQFFYRALVSICSAGPCIANCSGPNCSRNLIISLKKPEQMETRTTRNEHRYKRVLCTLCFKNCNAFLRPSKIAQYVELRRTLKSKG